MQLVLLVILLNVFRFSSCMYSTKEVEGYPTGYLSDCPRAEQEPIITKKSLKRLTILLQGNGTAITAKKFRYNYYQMRELAKNRNLDFSKNTVMYVGGFLDSPNFPFASSIAAVYKNLGYNVFLLDTNYFTTMEYPLAALYTRTVGKHAAEMLAILSKQGLDAKKLELVGLSLGGQTISFIAKNYRLATGRNISRITGLDPAGPCFRNLGPGDRLDQTDADFVDTINTNIDGFGMAAPVGHVNFYVNGGEFQPGDIVWMPCNVICSHVRAYTLWMSALLNQNSFVAMQCASVQEARAKECYDKVPQISNVLGPKTDRSKKGIFYLATDNNFPYYLGRKGLKRENEYFSSLMRNMINLKDMKI